MLQMELIDMGKAYLVQVNDPVRVFEKPDESKHLNALKRTLVDSAALSGRMSIRLCICFTFNGSRICCVGWNTGAFMHPPSKR